MDMKSLLVILSFLKFVTARRAGNIIALSDEEYDVMLKKIVGEFTKPSNERNKFELKMIRKYYRWLREGKDISIGASGKTIYVDGKQVMRKDDIGRAVSRAIKESKNAGNRKLTQRIKARFAGCSHRNVKIVKSCSKSLKVTSIFYLFAFIMFCNHSHITHAVRDAYLHSTPILFQVVRL